MGIAITGNVTDEKEKMAYVDYLQRKHNRKLASLDMEIDGNYVNLNYKFEPMGFERIRRITGYLVGTMEQWNDAKKSEEADRVKHGVTQRAERI